MKILIVEDEKLIAEDLKDTLLKGGYSITGIASTGKDAVIMAHQDPPDLILMDIVLWGEMDGIEAYEKIKAEKHIPLIYLSAHSDKATYNRAINTEPLTFLNKPISEEKLCDAIEYWMKDYLNKHKDDKVPMNQLSLDESFKILFQETPVAMREIDLSLFKQKVDILKKSGVKDFKEYYNKNRDGLLEFISEVKIVRVNRAMLDLYRARSEEELANNYKNTIIEESFVLMKEILIALAEDKQNFQGDTVIKNLDGEITNIKMKIHVPDKYRNTFERVFITLMDITDIRKAEDELRKTNSNLQALIDNTDDFILISDSKGVPVLFNKSYADVMNAALGIEMKPGIVPHRLLDDPDAVAVWDDYHRRVLGGEKFRIDYSHQFIDGSIRHLEVAFNPVREGEKVTGFTEVTRDITERKEMEKRIKASLKEKEVLLKEVHHRVKNNMAVISSLLNISSTYLKDKSDVELFDDTNKRIRSMALVHEKLYQSEDLSRINFKDYIKTLGKEIYFSINVPDKILKLEYDIADILMNIDKAIPCGLITTELITNAFKHAFKKSTEGVIKISFYNENENHVLKVSDNGSGLDKAFNADESHTLGLRLVHILTDQLKGNISINVSSGTEFSIIFPVD